MPNIRCKTCGLSMQIPAGGRRMCGCGAWLSDNDDEDQLAVVEDAEEPSATQPWPRIDGDMSAIERLNDGYRRIRKEMSKAVVGQERVLEELLIAVFARGHCLLVGVPGLAKTLIIRTLADSHSGPHWDVITWLGNYRAFTPGLGGAAEGTVRLGDSSEPQPDAALFILPGHGGRVRISVDDYLENGPELVAEVAASSIPLDTGLKLQMYLRYDVQEYIICRVPDHEIDWFVRRDSQFVQLAPDQDGRLCSEVFPGLWLDADALIRGDMAQVLSVLQLGLATAEHAAFVSRLNPPAS